MILRYANYIEFLYPTALELPKTKVDVMRRYSDDVEEKDFLITFLFDEPGKGESSEEETPGSMLLHIIEVEKALHWGWSVHPENFANDVMRNDLELLQNYYHGGIGVTSMPHAAPNMLLLTLALQLPNGDIDRAVHGFLEGTMKSMWKETSLQTLFSIRLEKELDDLLVLGRDIPQCLSTLLAEVDSREIQEEGVDLQFPKW